MQVDTGAAVTLMAVSTQQELFPDAHLEQASVKLQTYTAESLTVLGTMEVQIKYGNYVGKHVLYFVDGNGPTPTWAGLAYDNQIRLAQSRGGYCTNHISYIEVSIR